MVSRQWHGCCFCHSRQLAKPSGLFVSLDDVLMDEITKFTSHMCHESCNFFCVRKTHNSHLPRISTSVVEGISYLMKCACRPTFILIEMP